MQLQARALPRWPARQARKYDRIVALLFAPLLWGPMSGITATTGLAARFRGYLPVVVDVETGGLDARTHALLELAAVPLSMTPEGKLELGSTYHYHIQPFSGSKIDPQSLEINRIIPDHPFRFAVTETEALSDLFRHLRRQLQQTGCTRCVLVGHNAWFDLSFLNAAIARTRLKRNPFHAFTCFDTATLAGVVYGQTVLASAMQAAKIPFDSQAHHSALYDTEQTAKLFCQMVNEFGWPR